MKFDIITIFPGLFVPYLNEGMLKRARQKGLIDFGVHDLRDFTADKHRSVDDYPYGGGAGMVMKPEPFFSAVEKISPDPSARRVIMLSPGGISFSQDKAAELAAEERTLIFLCGRYEAIDERVRIGLADDEMSVGDFILTGGELAALVIIDAVSRLVPGVLGDEHSAEVESFTWGILDYPHYTRPPVFRGQAVPEMLLSGNHEKVRKWRRKEALRRTLQWRPDLLESAGLNEEDIGLLRDIKEESQ
jgi:tRNA (guanine37-N1)-methyltransferase